MLCCRCGREIEDGSLYCRYCGRKQNKRPAPKKKPKPRRAKGTGGIQYLPDLHKPYRVKLRGMWLGYYYTREEAEEVLRRARSLGRDLDYYNYTMQQVFEAVTSERAWLEKTAKYRKDIGASWNYMSDLHNRLARTVHKEDFQAEIYRAQDENKSRSHQEKLRVVAKKLCLWCTQHGLHAVDYSEGLTVNNNIKTERKAFTEKELRLFYQHRDERACAIIWFLCFTGCRPVDLGKIRKDDSIDWERRGIWLEGSKTRAGHNRFVAVDPATWKIFMQFWNAAEEGAPLFTSKQGGKWDGENFLKNEFYPTLDALGIPREGHVLYSCRRTFATLAQKSGMDKDTVQRAIGHEIGSNVTDEHYIDQVAHVDSAVLEFKKLAQVVKKITG